LRINLIRKSFADQLVDPQKQITQGQFWHLLTMLGAPAIMLGAPSNTQGGSVSIFDVGLLELDEQIDNVRDRLLIIFILIK